MSQHTVRYWVIALLSLLVLAGARLAAAESVSSVGRLSYISGRASFLPAGESEWAQVGVNQPLTAGDRLWFDNNGRGELQLGGTGVRLAGNSDLTIRRFDDDAICLQLSKGTMIVKLRRITGLQSVEVETPNLSIVLRQPGEYRLDVDAQMVTTTLHLRSGQAELRNNGSAYVVTARSPLRFTGMDLRDYQQLNSASSDSFDQWSTEREQQLANSVSSRYVSPDVIGHEELDNYGSWGADPEYGNIWYPTHVSFNWSPYQNGYWSWVIGWGWTWVDDAPWGFAVTHYGRWVSLRGRWCWVPGPIRQRTVYAPVHEGFRNRAPAIVGRPGVTFRPDGDYRNEQRRNGGGAYSQPRIPQPNTSQNRSPIERARDTINSPEFNQRNNDGTVGRTNSNARSDVNGNPAYMPSADAKGSGSARNPVQAAPLMNSAPVQPQAKQRQGLQPEVTQPTSIFQEDRSGSRTDTRYRGNSSNTALVSNPVSTQPSSVPNVAPRRERSVAPQATPDTPVSRPQSEQRRNESRNDEQNDRQFQRLQFSSPRQPAQAQQSRQFQTQQPSSAQGRLDRDGRGGSRRSTDR